jgi:hypothetical protein
MAKRPALTEDSFLQHLFSPKRNPLPSGIRKRPLTAGHGRAKGRVASYNRMSGASQEILRRSGMRDAYLAGSATLTDAKKSLRVTAVRKGFAKPLRAKLAPSKPISLDALAGHIVRTLRTAGKEYDDGAIYDNLHYLPPDMVPEVRKWDYGRIKAYAGDRDNWVIAQDGSDVNPLWYHAN